MIMTEFMHTIVMWFDRGEQEKKRGKGLSSILEKSHLSASSHMLAMVICCGSG